MLPVVGLLEGEILVADLEDVPLAVDHLEDELLVVVDLVRRGSPLEPRWLQNISLRGK